jgi:hypothetical protein
MRQIATLAENHHLRLSAARSYLQYAADGACRRFTGIEQLLFHGEQHTVLPVNGDGNRVVHPAGELQRPGVAFQYTIAGAEGNVLSLNGTVQNGQITGTWTLESNRLQRERKLHDDAGRITL